ncbi:MAG TPA: DUF6328 family protein [Microlunatus sp.]|nr:DUF6328 family protein [Microlunatus sp.]
MRVELNAVEDGRNESVNERMDRNWNEILQEVRVTQTGTQIIGGFLLILAFQPSFKALGPFDHVLYVSLLVIATVTTVLALSPVHLHRSLFRRGAKVVLVQFGHVLLRWALFGLAITLVGAVLLVIDVATGHRSLALLIAALVALTVTVLAALPFFAQSGWAHTRVHRSVRRADRLVVD